MTTIPKPSGPTSGYTATYDAWNRLVKIVDAENTVAEYRYDGAKRRIVKKTYSGGVLDETRHFYYNVGWQCLEERVDSSSNADRHFIWGLRYIDDLVLRDRDTSGTGCRRSTSTGTTSSGQIVSLRFPLNPAGLFSNRQRREPKPGGAACFDRLDGVLRVDYTPRWLQMGVRAMVRWLALSVLPMLGIAGWADADTRIVVNLGSYASAEVAGHAEAEVDWLDADASDDTVCTECFAALELQRVLRKMTTRAGDFSIIDDDAAEKDGELILVGGPKSNAVSRRLAEHLGAGDAHLDKLGPEGYCIRSTVIGDRRVTVVAGGGRVGTLYGTYDLLYRLGCRWFAPGEAHEDVPATVQIPDMDVSERPAFSTRGFHAWENRADRDFLLWMARNRLNYWCVEQNDHPLMRKLGIQMSCGGHHAQSLFVGPHLPYPYDHSRFDADNGKPVDPYPVSKHYPGDTDGDGTLSYFEAHPEWYAMVDGRRIAGMRADRPGFGTNCCTSNRHAIDELMKNHVQALIDGPYAGADVVRFWTLDVGKWCQCPECKALGTRTDRNLLLVHRFDEEIKRARAAGRINRPVIVRFLAYADVLEPPSRPLANGFDYATCSATFFPIVRCYVHNFDDPTCPTNARYSRQLAGWATDPDRRYRGEICIGEYYNVSGYRCLPICFMHTMASDIPYYWRVGARHFHYMHVTTGNWGSKTLTNYQMARQIWDVDTDCEALWADYFARRYGKAADSMRAFYESLERMLANVSELKYGLARRLGRGALDLFPNSHFRQQQAPGVKCDGPTLREIVGHAQTCRALIDQVLAMDLPERIQARVAEDERLFTYAQQTVAYYDACVRAFGLGRAGKIDEAKGHFAEAKRLAHLLRQDSTSTQLSYSPIVPNAIVASDAAGALEHLAKLLDSTGSGARMPPR